MIANFEMMHEQSDSPLGASTDISSNHVKHMHRQGNHRHCNWDLMFEISLDFMLLIKTLDPNLFDVIV